MSHFNRIVLTGCAAAALGIGVAQAAVETTGRIETVVVTAEKRIAKGLQALVDG